MDNKSHKKYENILRVFNSMLDYIENSILEEQVNKSEMIADFESMKEAIVEDDWESQIKNQEGILLSEKQKLLLRLDKVNLLIDKVSDVRAFW